MSSLRACRRNLAIKPDVKIVYGTDIGERNHAMEFDLLIGNGMSAMQAIFATTRNAAELIGASDRIGSVRAGRCADIIAVDTSHAITAALQAPD
jgi:imidazolonepropionase-like amidohydrolase